MKKPASTDTKTAKKRAEWPRVRHIEGRQRPWMVDCRINGKGERFFFETAAEADTKADLKRLEKQQSGKEGVMLSEALRLAAMDAEKRLRSVGATITEAVDFFLAHARPGGGERTIAQVIEEFIAAKRTANRKETYLKIQTYVLSNVFGEVFGERKAQDVTAPEIEAWMNAQDWSGRTRLNYFSDVRNLFGFAVRRGYRPNNPMLVLEKPSVMAAKPGVLTVQQASSLLSVAEAGEGEMLAAVALGLFAGLRTCELELIQWENIDLGARNIHITPEITKRVKGLNERDVEISENLLAWLAPVAKKSGPVAPPKSFDYRLAKLAESSEIAVWPKNAMRHSFASYHLKHFKNAPLTATQLGHMGSTKTLFDKYQTRVTPADAARYWELKPTLGASSKIVSIDRVAA